MKYSFMTFSCKDASLDEVLALAKKYGYDGFEARIDSEQAHGIEKSTTPQQRREIAERIAQSGTAIACVATSCRYADPEIREEQVAATLEAIDLASDVGASTIRVFGGKLGKDVTREQAIDLLVESLETVEPRARERGITVCVETHDDWCDPKHLAQVMKKVDKPAIAANWDIMHPVRAGLATIDESFETLKPWINHTHIHDGVQTGGKLELVPIGNGMVDHRRAMELLATIPFDGYLSGEWINWEPADVHLPREIAILKKYERELAG